MGKGSRHREQRRLAREEAERQRLVAEREREVAEEKAAMRAAFFASFDGEDSTEGPALPCPECAAFDRRWATVDEAAEALAAFDAEWGLGDERAPMPARKVAVCNACGAASVVPDLPG